MNAEEEKLVNMMRDSLLQSTAQPTNIIENPLTRDDLTQENSSGNDTPKYSYVIESISEDQLCRAKVYLGVNEELDRVLLIQVVQQQQQQRIRSPSVLKTDLSHLSLCKAILKNSSVILDHYRVAVSVSPRDNMEEGLLDSQLVVAGLNFNPLYNDLDEYIDQATARGKTDSRRKQNLLDFGFVRDLQATCAQKMNSKLFEIAKNIDLKLKGTELKCAKLMTILKPSKFLSQ